MKPRHLFLLLLLCGAASADGAEPYSISYGEPVLGTSKPRGRVGLGIAVNIDKHWEALAEPDRAAWRAYTEMSDPDIVPPFPLPHIRSFLKRLDTHDFPSATNTLVREEAIVLVVRVSETGKVSQVEVMDASKDGSGTMTVEEKTLAARYVTALLATPFSPASYKGHAAPSAFIMRISSITFMH